MDFTKMSKEDIYKYLKAFIESNLENDKAEFQKEGADEEKYETMDWVYKDYNAKLEYIMSMDENSPIWTKYINMLILIQNGITNKPALLETLLSVAPILKSFKNAVNLSDANLLMVSFCTRQVELEDYSFYTEIMVDPELATRITSKTLDLDNQFDIAEAVMNYLDGFKDDCIHADDYEPLRQGSLEVINNYEIPRVR